ncbi:MAG: hypothetical protein KAR83_09330 [Thermodesulfovibrionales bacterium]|nr:hypothetical protein [Thermodesulfovibrionales bacterium]
MKKTLILMLVTLIAALAYSSTLLYAEEVFHGGDVVYTEPLKAVIFSHKAHVEDMGMSCEMCHPDLFMMSNLAAQENDDFTMQSLYDGKYCGACHNGSWAFASDTQCARCHIGVKGYQAMTGQSDKAEEGHH